jgi:hypothetical protein
MSTTAIQIIQEALQVIGVYNATDTLSADDATLGLQVLNDMVDSWSNESLTTYCYTENSGTLVVGQQSYTVGVGGNFNVVRPLRIPEGPGMARVRDANNNDFDVTVVSRDVWNMIGDKTNTSDIPDTLFYDPQYPLGIINIFPIPQIAYTLFFDSYQPLANFASLSSVLTLPAGYSLAIKRNLAVELHPYFLDGDVPQSVLKSAAISKGNVKRTNTRPSKATFDPEIVSRASPTYNIARDRAGGY